MITWIWTCERLNLRRIELILDLYSFKDDLGATFFVFKVKKSRIIR